MTLNNDKKAPSQSIPSGILMVIHVFHHRNIIKIVIQIWGSKGPSQVAKGSQSSEATRRRPQYGIELFIMFIWIEWTSIWLYFAFWQFIVSLNSIFSFFVRQYFIIDVCKYKCISWKPFKTIFMKLEQNNYLVHCKINIDFCNIL